VLRWLKRRIAYRANQLRGGDRRHFWQRERYEYLVRNQREYRRLEAYILHDPVRAGLARTDEEYRWSSAFNRAAGFSLRGTSVPLVGISANPERAD
jgi:hypothetical protein